MSTLNKELVRIARTDNPDDFRRDRNLIPTDVRQLIRIDDVLRKLAHDDGADITDGASDDEK